MFTGFKPQGLQKIASKMGYAGQMDKFDQYLEQNPDKQREMIVYQGKAQQMARGGVVRRFAVGGDTGTPADTGGTLTTMAYGEEDGGGVGKIPSGIISSDPVTAAVPEDGNYSTLPELNIPTGQSPDPRQLAQADVPTLAENPYGAEDTIGDVTAKRLQTPSLPTGGVTIPVGTQIEDQQLIDDGLGQVEGDVNVNTSVAGTTTADAIVPTTANTVTADEAATKVDSALATHSAAQTDPDDARAKVVAAETTVSSVSSLDAAQGSAHLLENPLQREIQDGELISGAADAEKAAKFTEQIDAATATPSEKATVQGQLKTLTEGFDAGNPPPWAAATLRGVQSQMLSRGMGASSMAGQAMIQGALESALPIAQADAATNASFEAQNLSNRQARAMLAAEQRATFIGQEFDQEFQSRVKNSARIGDIANMNFTAEQNIALENSRAVNTMNLANLGNKQALVMAEASALANLDTANLNNRQQASVQNAQNFLQLDLANLSNEQQMETLKLQQRTQAIFNDQAAVNAAAQFNATSKNQVDQFFANLSSSTSQFNATQTNAQAQFNAGQENTVERFNAEVNNQRDQYNATNQLAIAQNNAVWRREIATADTAAVNRANELNASAVLDISKEAYDNMWSHYNDTMEWAWTAADNELERINKMAIAELSATAMTDSASMASSSAAGTAVGNLISTLGKEFIIGSFN